MLYIYILYIYISYIYIYLSCIYIYICMVLLSQLSAPLFSAGHTCKSCWPIWPGTGICCYSCSWLAAAVRAAIGQLLKHMRLEHVGLLFARCVIQGHCTMLS